MRSIIGGFLILLATQVSAQEQEPQQPQQEGPPKPMWEAKLFPEALGCGTNPATVGVELINTGDKVTLQFVNQVGPQASPVYAGMVVPADFQMLEQIRVLSQKIGPGFKTAFNRNQCNYYGSHVVSCVNPQAPKMKVGKSEIQVQAVSTIATMNISALGRNEEINYYIRVVVDGTPFDMPITFPKQNCGEKPSKETALPIPRDPETEKEI